MGKKLEKKLNGRKGIKKGACYNHIKVCTYNIHAVRKLCLAFTLFSTINNNREIIKLRYVYTTSRT